ncbi:hypothetical protein BD777DRAFT_123759 [Yarrowia lipolytica]|uniref:Uncharacterized protein n=1 Tax=Yarrowia lipolytica TaxID=4952 RepID=A0A1D8NFW8_YARLL|nr:hypothetical protein YALI1_D30685g [Yarrowia lipolytica]RMI99295.1 hypothetical protein BD777DRAFT_123759 [Yarrowia lipolytica]
MISREFCYANDSAAPNAPPAILMTSISDSLLGYRFRSSVWSIISLYTHLMTWSRRNTPILSDNTPEARLSPHGKIIYGVQPTSIEALSESSCFSSTTFTSTVRLVQVPAHGSCVLTLNIDRDSHFCCRVLIVEYHKTVQKTSSHIITNHIIDQITSKPSPQVNHADQLSRHSDITLIHNTTARARGHL